MDLCPAHPIWQRERQPYHGGASRLYPPEDEEPFNPKGPDGTPVFCDRCKVETHENMKILLAQDENIIPAYNTLNECEFINTFYLEVPIYFSIRYIISIDFPNPASPEVYYKIHKSNSCSQWCAHKCLG